MAVEPDERLEARRVSEGTLRATVVSFPSLTRRATCANIAFVRPSLTRRATWAEWAL
jgi:hypothetical protein